MNARSFGERERSAMHFMSDLGHTNDHLNKWDNEPDRKIIACMFQTYIGQHVYALRATACELLRALFATHSELFTKQTYNYKISDVHKNIKKQVDTWNQSMRTLHDAIWRVIDKYQLQFKYHQPDKDLEIRLVTEYMERDINELTHKLVKTAINVAIELATKIMDDAAVWLAWERPDDIALDFSRFMCDDGCECGCPILDLSCLGKAIRFNDVLKEIERNPEMVRNVKRLVVKGNDDHAMNDYNARGDIHKILTYLPNCEFIVTS